MNPSFTAFALIPLISLPASFASIEYPETRNDNVKDLLHGIEISDPFRWLEDDQSEETGNWVAAQNAVTNAFLESIPQRDEIRERLSSLWNYERVGTPVEYGGKWFYSRNPGLLNQAHLMVSDSPDKEGRLLIDPNTFSEDSTIALANWTPSENGKWLAYGISKGGSDWREIFVLNVDTGEILDDHLQWVKFSSLSWAKNDSGFYYSRYDEPEEGAALTQTNEFQKLYFHKLGTPQEEDALIYERPDEPRWGLGGWVSEDGEFLLINVSDGTDPNNRFFYKPLDNDKTEVVELLTKADARYSFIDNKGSLFYFRTDLDAPRYRVIAIDIHNPSRENWKEIIPESTDQLAGVSSVGEQLICHYLQDAKSAVRCYNFNGELIRDLQLPGIGSVGGFSGRSTDTSTFYTFTSFTDPGAIYQLDLATGESTLHRRPNVDFNPDDYETKQEFITSKDGTKIPIFIVHKKDIKLDGSHRTLLYGYGGFNISMTPSFSITRTVWLERGGIFVMANLRGGGEYGRDWHLAGTRLQKQNVFDDFIAAAEWLVDKNYTSPANLAIQGGSNGGLLVAACINQRPDLFGAALPSVGVMDMLRFHKFTIGWAWERDYGNPDNPEEFQALLAYSPYHNLQPNTRYPATLITTADHDDRVVPAHSFKYAARIQQYQSKNGPPVLIRIETSAGHGAGTALDKIIDKTTDEWAFLEATLGN